MLSVGVDVGVGSGLNRAQPPSAMAVIIMIDEKGKEYSIYFSGIAGEEATIKLKDDKVEEEKGHDVKTYSKYFDIPEEDRKYL